MSTTGELVVVGDDLDLHYSAAVLADSVSPDGVRLTTFKLTYPRFIHSEMMTHRDKSRNAASSRAIPTERLIKQVREDPFVPATFNQRVVGMGVGAEMDEEASRNAGTVWRMAAASAADHAEALMDIGLDKSRANRLLEPFLWYVAIFSGTEWANMLALRDHPGAQPEIQAVARCLRRGFAESEPQELDYGQWHLPLLTREELTYLCRMRGLEDQAEISGVIEHMMKLSASRCARVSFDRDDVEPVEKTIARADLLLGNGHFSPFEHVARPATWEDSPMWEWTGGEYGRPPEQTFVANYRGWVSMRKAVRHEDRFDLFLAEQEGSTT